MFLHQGADILINAIGALINITYLKTTNKVQIPAHFIATVLTKLTGRCITTTLCILDVEIDKLISIQNQQLDMML